MITSFPIFSVSIYTGPCIGITRLKRYERAEKLGLKPPVEVKELLTKQQQGEVHVNPLSSWENITRRVLVEQGWMKSEDEKITIKQHFTPKITV
jgi:hypothetical protein